MKKRRKSTWIFVAFLIYVTALMFYLIPRNGEISQLEKYTTIGVAYIIIFLLWGVLRKKENMKRRREEEQSNTNIKKD